MIKIKHPKASIALSALILSTVLLGCVPTTDPVAPVEPIDPVEVEANCETSCAHLRGEDGSGLDCELGKKSPRGNTCETDCAKIEANGVQWVACTIEATSCADAEHC
jgi:hypothetical protein